jgi:maltooligosyltrehalose trehalohydrolase
MKRSAFRFGPRVGVDATCFRLWSPDAASIAVEIEGRPPVPLRPVADGWGEAEIACGPGTRYRFRLADGGLVPDPASRAQPDGVFGPSLVVDGDSYEWRCLDWRGRPWEETVFYELHAGLLGGFNGVADRLPALAELGVTAIELMPIAEFSGARNWGYDGVLPFAPESAYGAPDDLKALVDRAHELGLTIFLDVVYNHFGPDGNWLPVYAPGFFRDDIPTPWGAAIDFAKEEVRRFFIENALYWLGEFRFDGLRLDAVHAICDPGWLDELAAEVRTAFPSRHVHLVVENEHNEATHLRRGVAAQWNDDWHNALHVVLTGETHAYYKSFADRPMEKLARGLAEGFIYQGELSPHHGGKPRGSFSADLPPTAFVSFLQNHDQIGNRALGERLTVLAEPERLKAAIALLLLCPQIPLIFMGEEIGARTPFLFFTDFHDGLADAVRQGRRREFAGFPGFEDADDREKIPDPNALSTFEASCPLGGADAEIWRVLYKSLLELRHKHIVPGLKGARSLGAKAVSDRAVFASWRLGNGALLTLVSNFGDIPVALPLPAVSPIWGRAEDGAIQACTTAAWMEPT